MYVEVRLCRLWSLVTFSVGASERMAPLGTIKMHISIRCAPFHSSSVVAQRPVAYMNP